MVPKLLKTSRAAAALRGRDFVTPDDVKAIAELAIAHRIILKPEHQIKGLEAGGHRAICVVCSGLNLKRYGQSNVWSRKSTMLGSLAVAMYLLGLSCNTQLVVMAVTILCSLHGLLLRNHADVASSGRRAEWTGEEGVALGNVVAILHFLLRMFEDSELNVTLRMQNTSSLPRFWKSGTVFQKSCASGRRQLHPHGIGPTT